MKALYTTADVANMLEQLGAQPVSYHASFARLAGSVTAGLMLSHTLFHSLRKEAKQNKGWFPKPVEEWESETGLTRNEQDTARKRLVSMGLIDIKKRGMPHQIFYRLKDEVLVSALCGLMREMPVEKIANLYASQLSRLSALAEQRAKINLERLKLQRPQVVRLPIVERVSYAEVLIRDEGRCHLCKEQIRLGPGRSPESLSFDHKVALNRGGDHAAANVHCAHMKCNLEKGSELERESTSGLLFHHSGKEPTHARAAATTSDNTPEPRNSGGTNNPTQNLPLSDGTEYNVAEAELKLWENTYPDVDVQQQLRAMHQWCIANPHKLKPASGIRAFITRWLSRHQDRGGRAPMPSLREQRDTARALEGTRGREDDVMMRCWHCNTGYDWTVRRTAATVDADSVFCSDPCRDEYAAWKAEAIARGVSMDVIRREKRA